MAIEGDEEGSAGPLQSEEQRLRRSRNDETVNVSKAKLYSMYGVILMLLGALAVTNGSDWSSFRGEVKAEKEVVSLDRMTEVERPPSLPVMNPRGRAAEGDFGEEERERQVQQLLADARAAVEKRRAENGEAGAEGSGNGDDAEDLPPPPAEEQGVESEEEEKETTPPPPPPPPRPSPAAKESKPEGDAKVTKAIKKAKRKAEKERKRTNEKKKELSGEGEEKSEAAVKRAQKRKEKYLQSYREKMARHKAMMVPRNYVLPAAKKKIVDDFAGSLQPPRYCYTSVLGSRVLPREPDDEDAKYANLPLPVARKVLKLLAADYPCLVLNQACMRKETMGEDADLIFGRYDSLYFNGSALTREEKIARTPDFSELRLGTCAIVGNADNVLTGKFGEEIDGHDFVARFNVATHDFKEFVGAKTGGMFIKVGYRASEFHRDFAPTKFNLFPKFIPHELSPRSLPGKRPPLIYGQEDGEMPWRRDLEQMFYAFLEAKNLTNFAGAPYGVPKLPHPTGGITRLRALVQMLSSGICDRLDVYGFSVGGGKYFDRTHFVSHAHPISSENYFIRLLMATGVHGKLCVYGK